MRIFFGWGENRKSNGMKTRRPREIDIEVYSFPQTWSSTALGFSGIGGQAITTETTVVVICYREACVYFGGLFAYKIKEFGSTLFDDIAERNMHKVAGAHNRYENGH